MRINPRNRKIESRRIEKIMRGYIKTQITLIDRCMQMQNLNRCLHITIIQVEAGEEIFIVI